MTVQPGTSGGPWVNGNGELVGVQSGIMTINKSNSGLAFMGGLKHVKELVRTKKSAKTLTIEVIPELHSYSKTFEIHVIYNTRN